MYSIMILYNDNKKGFVSNTHPICWTYERSESKRYNNKKEARDDVYSDFIYLAGTLNFYCVKGLYLVKVLDNKIVEAEDLLI